MTPIATLTADDADDDVSVSGIPQHRPLRFCCRPCTDTEVLYFFGSRLSYAAKKLVLLKCNLCDCVCVERKPVYILFAAAAASSLRSLWWMRNPSKKALPFIRSSGKLDSTKTVNECVERTKKKRKPTTCTKMSPGVKHCVKVTRGAAHPCAAAVAATSDRFNAFFIMGIASSVYLLHNTLAIQSISDRLAPFIQMVFYLQTNAALLYEAH